MAEERCVCCGKIIPDGQQVCPQCMRKASLKTVRDPNRIDNFCRMLSYYWHRVPDWRFGQLISNVLGAYQEETHKDIFFPEDHEFLEFFDKYFSMEGSSPYVSGNEEKK